VISDITVITVISVISGELLANCQLPIAICYLLLSQIHTDNAGILTGSNIRGGEDILP